MHFFQPLSTDYLEMNPFNKIGKEWMLITAGNKEKQNTMTASWGGVGVMWGKAVVYIFVRDSRYTKEFLDREKMFSVSFLDAKYHRELKYLGMVSGRDEDKIANARLTVNHADGEGYKEVPFIDESSLVLICRKLSCTRLSPEQFLDGAIDGTWYKDKDYHNMYIGEIVQAMAR